MDTEQVPECTSLTFYCLKLLIRKLQKIWNKVFKYRTIKFYGKKALEKSEMIWSKQPIPLQTF